MLVFTRRATPGALRGSVRESSGGCSAENYNSYHLSHFFPSQPSFFHPSLHSSSLVSLTDQGTHHPPLSWKHQSRCNADIGYRCIAVTMAGNEAVDAEVNTPQTIPFQACSAMERTFGLPELLNQVLTATQDGERILSTTDLFNCQKVNNVFRDAFKGLKNLQADIFLGASNPKINATPTLMEIHPGYKHRDGVDVSMNASLPAFELSTPYLFTPTIHYRAENGLPAFTFTIDSKEGEQTATFSCVFGNGTKVLATMAKKLEHSLAKYLITKPAFPTIIIAQMTVRGHSDVTMIGQAKVRPCSIGKMFEVAAHLVIKAVPKYANNAKIPTVGQFLKVKGADGPNTSVDGSEKPLLLETPAYHYDCGGWEVPEGLPKLPGTETRSTTNELMQPTEAVESAPETQTPSSSVPFFFPAAGGKESQND